ncbi:hypothetical protein GCM10027346_00450 [Hymenobacter seoulensis]
MQTTPPSAVSLWVLSSLPISTIMAKAQEPRKEKKKEPAKTTKEKKAAKEEKKALKSRQQD